MDVVEGEVVGGEQADNAFPSLEQVNKNALKKLNDLILQSEPETAPALIEALAKYNSSIRNNAVFASKESEAEKAAREKTNLVEDLLHGK